MTDEEQEAISQYFGAPDGGFAGFPLYDVSIHRYDLSSSENTVVYNAPETAASIGRIFAVGDGKLVFSQIPNLQDWIAAIAAGEFDPSSPEDTAAQQLATVPVPVFTLDLESGELTQVGEGINRFTPKA